MIKSGRPRSDQGKNCKFIMTAGKTSTEVWAMVPNLMKGFPGVSTMNSY